MAAKRFSVELGDRLRQVYGLERRPRDADGFFRSLRAESAKHPGTKKFLSLVKSGKSVIGRSDVPTKDWIITDSREKVFTFCSYDTLMTAILQGTAEVGSSCPHCGERMSVRISGGKLQEHSPEGTVFFWGAGPEGAPGNPMCDHLHLFPDAQHMVAWIASKEGELGFSFRLQDAVSHLKDRF